MDGRIGGMCALKQAQRGPMRVLCALKQTQHGWSNQNSVWFKENTAKMVLSKFCLLYRKHSNNGTIRILYALKQTQYGWFYENSLCF